MIRTGKTSEEEFAEFFKDRSSAILSRNTHNHLHYRIERGEAFISISRVNGWLRKGWVELIQLKTTGYKYDPALYRIKKVV